MIGFSIKTKVPVIDIETPEDKIFWEGVGTEAVKHIRKRTETFGRDVEGQKFAPYTKETRKDRVKRGRSPWPNLSDTGKMLGAMATGIRAKKNKVILRLSGQEGYKAWQNEKRGRKFFGLDEKIAGMVLERVKKWMARENDLK